ncbi:hypothetical protein OCF61_28570 [Bacillus cereus]|nr:hypothetical protein [Bacillus cereus]
MLNKTIDCSRFVFNCYRNHQKS